MDTSEIRLLGTKGSTSQVLSTNLRMWTVGSVSLLLLAVSASANVLKHGQPKTLSKIRVSDRPHQLETTDWASEELHYKAGNICRLQLSYSLSLYPIRVHVSGGCTIVKGSIKLQDQQL